MASRSIDVAPAAWDGMNYVTASTGSEADRVGKNSVYAVVVTTDSVTSVFTNRQSPVSSHIHARCVTCAGN